MNKYWTDRPVLVTGATGIVGAWLCKELLARGASVTAFVYDDNPQSEFFRSKTAESCSIVRGDLTRYEDCARAVNLSECETIFHLGAQTLVGAALRDPLETFESNIRGTYHILETSRRFASLVKSVVIASSDKAYGDSQGIPYDENMPMQGRHPYDVSKSCADLLTTSYAKTYGLCVATTRCGNIYGGGDLNWSRIVPGTIRSFARGLAPVLRSDGRFIRDYIYVRDVVSAYLRTAEAVARESIAGEAFNFSCESRVTVFDIVERIRELMGVSIEPIVLDQAKFEIPEQVLSARKAREVLGWTPQWSLDDGLAETISWYRSFFADRQVRELVDALR